MSDADDLGRTRPTAGATLQNDGLTTPTRLPEEPVGRFEGASKELGRGGMGRVLEVQDVALGRPVALKELLDTTASPARFIREARLTAQLEHPGVVPVYELGQRRDGAPYYAMRKVHGGTLEDAIGACSSLEERLTLLPHLLDVVQTIAYAHSKGVLHRDLKPANVMVGKFGETLVLDWGLARPKSEPEAPVSAAGAPPSSQVQTHEGASVGTPAYMSPEQARGEKDLDERADVWSLGVMLFELLTGRAPFEADTVIAMLVQVSQETPPRVRAVEPRAPAVLAEIADAALAKDKSTRFPSAVEMAVALEEAMRTHARPRRWSWALVGAVALVLAIVPVFGWEKPKPPPAPKADTAALDESTALRAQAAWDEGDIASARELANRTGHPLARGVLALTEAAGVPEKVWSASTAAGCSQLAVLEGRVACSTFGGLEFFSADDGTALQRFSTGPAGWQHAVVGLENDKLFAAGGDDGVVRILRPGNPTQEVERLAGLAESVRSLAPSPDGSELAVGLRDGSVLRWKRTEILSQPLFTLKGPIAALAWSRDGLLAASGKDVTRVVNMAGPSTGTRKGEAPTPLLELDRPAPALAFSSSWPLYVSAGRDVLALAPGSATRVFSGARHDLSAVVVLGQRLLAGSIDGAAQSWTTDGASLGALRTFDPGRLVLAAEPRRSGASPDFYAATGKVVQAWRWRRERFTQPPPELPSEPTAFTFTADGAWCAGLRDGHLACSQPGRVPALHLHSAPPVALAVVKKGEGWCSLSAAEDGSVVLVVPGQDPSLALSRKDRLPLAVALAPDAARAAVSWDDGTLVLYSLEYGKEIESLRDANVLALAFSADGRSLAAARADKRVALYLADTGHEVTRLEGADGKLRAVAFMPDGSGVAAAGDDRRVSVWSVPSGRLEATLTGPWSSIGALAVSRDGSQFAAASDDGTVRIWNGRDARAAVEVRGHFGDARAIGFGADGAVLEAGGDGVPRRLVIRN